MNLKNKDKINGPNGKIVPSLRSYINFLDSINLQIRSNFAELQVSEVQVFTFLIRFHSTTNLAIKNINPQIKVQFPKTPFCDVLHTAEISFQIPVI